MKRATREDKTDVLKILCDVRGADIKETKEYEWLWGFRETCKADGEVGAAGDIKEYIRFMPDNDTLLAALATLTKWEYNTLHITELGWTLGENAAACPLCKVFIVNPHNCCNCNGCPLTYFGGPCRLPTAPWQQAIYGDDTTPLIKALRKAVKYAVKEERNVG